MYIRRGIKDVKHSGLFNLLMKSFVVRAFAEEDPKADGGDTTPKTPETTSDSGQTPPVFNFEQMIAQARKEEKEKLYPEITKLRQELKVMTANNNNNLLEIARLKEEIETYKKNNGESEEVLKLKEDLKKVNEEFAEYKKNTVSEEELRKTLEAEYEVKNYLSEQKVANKDKVLPMFLETISGDSKEVIDEEIKKAIEMTEQAKKQLGATSTNAKTSNTNNPPIASPNGGSPTKTFDLEAIRNMDVRSPEYAEWRKAQGLK